MNIFSLMNDKKAMEDMGKLFGYLKLLPEIHTQLIDIKTRLMDIEDSIKEKV